MIVKNLTVGKGLQAYRLYSQPLAAVSVGMETPDQTSDEVHRIFYERLMSESEKIAQRVASTTPAAVDESTDLSARDCP
jgi:hypothetical protein